MKSYPWSVRARILLRSFAIQGSWNYETLIGAGFAFTLLPALRHLYGDSGARLDSAVARHVGLFNSHPYFATIAIGAAAKLEADGAEPAVIDRFKVALRGSLGSLGDQLIWSAWRPMAVMIGLVLLLAGAAWWVAVIGFLVLYNTLHLAVRVLGLRMGSETGLELGRVLREAPIQPLIDRASQIACALVGLAVVLAAAPTPGEPAEAAAAALAVALGLWLGMNSRRVLIALLGGITILALLLGLTGYGA
jgi:PTS system mannose-specific IID component